VADSAGTKLPICAKNTIKPTCKEKSTYRKNSYSKYIPAQKVEREMKKKDMEGEARKKVQYTNQHAEAFSQMAVSLVTSSRETTRVF